MKRKLIIGAAAVVVAAAIAVPWWQVHRMSVKSAQTDYLADAQAKFVQQYGAQNTIIKTETLDKLLVAYWTDNTSLHVSIELGEGWVEIYRTALSEGK